MAGNVRARLAPAPPPLLGACSKALPQEPSGANALVSVRRLPPPRQGSQTLGAAQSLPRSELAAGLRRHLRRKVHRALLNPLAQDKALEAADLDVLANARNLLLDVLCAKAQRAGGWQGAGRAGVSCA